MWFIKLFQRIKKPLAGISCANCEYYEPHKNDPEKGKGFCPKIYWSYNILTILPHFFCRPNFRLAERFRANFRIDWKTRKNNKCLIKAIEDGGIKKRSAMLGDDVLFRKGI